jgi:hypothetical protein
MKSLDVLIGCITLLFIVTFSGVTVHEEAHVQIYKNYGCPNATYQFNLPFPPNEPIAYTTCNNHSDIYDEEDMRFLHSLNEVFGYQIMIQTLCIVATMIMISLIIILRLENIAERDVARRCH